MIDVSQSTEYFLIISAKPELKLGQRLVDGRIVNVCLRNSAEILVDWPFKKAIVDLSIRMKGDLKGTTGNSSVGDPELGYRRGFADLTNGG